MTYFHPDDPTGQNKEWKGYIGTGFLVGNKYVFTAGHNIFYFNPYHEGKWGPFPNIIEFYPGFNGNNFFMDGKTFKAPLLSENTHKLRSFVPKADIITVHSKWKNNEYSDHDENPYDFAGIILDREIKSNGYFYPRHHNKNEIMEKKVSVTGYPGEDDTGNETSKMYTMEGKITELCGCRVHYPINTSAGQSGSPVWYQDEDRTVACAIHIGAHHGKLNTGTRLTDWLIKYMENEWSIKF